MRCHRVPLDALMEERWGFLAPWCAVLKRRLSYTPPGYRPLRWSTTKWVLEVRVPTQRGSFNSRGRVGHFLEGYDGVDEFHLVREALALLSAVAHIDHEAWKYLLEVHCDAHLGNAGRSGELPARFVLLLDTGVTGKPFEGQYNYDLLQFCGVDQRRTVSRAYSTTLARIAALKTDGDAVVDIKVPVKVYVSSALEVSRRGFLPDLVDVMNVDQAVRHQWSDYEPEPVAVPAALQVTFELEPNIVEIMDDITVDISNTLVGFLKGNVYFSEVALCAYVDSELRADAYLSKTMVGQLLAHLFTEVSTTPSADDGPELQVANLHVDCAVDLPVANVEQMGSALAFNDNTDLGIRCTTGSDVQ